MGSMRTVVYKIAIFILRKGIITSALKDISIMISIIAKRIIFLTTLVLIINRLNLFHWDLIELMPVTNQTLNMDE